MERVKRGYLLIISVVLIVIPVLLGAEFAKSELRAAVIVDELTGSRELHKRLGQNGTFEKLYATITFKKRTNDEAFLTNLGFRWNGPHLERPFFASLFKLDGNGTFLPTEEYLVSETRLNENDELRFRLTNPIELHGSTSFALVFVLSEALEKSLRKGNFSFIQETLPEPFQNVSKDILAFTFLPKKKKDFYEKM